MAEIEFIDLRVEPDATYVAPMPGQLMLAGPTPEMLAMIGVPSLKEIARLRSPTVIYPKIEKYEGSDPSEISDIIHSDVALAETAFWDETICFAAMLEGGAVDFIRKCGMVFQEDEGDSAFLIRIWRERSDLFADAAGVIRANQGPGFGGKSSAVFVSSLPASVVTERLANIDTDLLATRAKKFFENKGYGDFCEVSMHKAGGRIGFAFYRCGRQSNEAKVDASKKRRFRQDRPIRTDIVFFIPETNTLWVHARSGDDVEMYVDCFGEMIGSAATFRSRQTFDLSIFMNKKLGEKLQSVALELELSRIDLKKIEIQVGQNGKYTDGVSRTGSCLTDRYEAIGFIHPGNTMKYVRMRVHLDLKKKVYVDVDIQPEKISAGIGLGDETLSALFSKMGIWKAPADA